MKTCTQCGQAKPLGDFYKHPAMSDGHLSACKECTKKRVRIHRAANLDRIREYDRKRGQDPKRKEANRDRYKKVVATPEGKERIRKYGADWKSRNPRKRSAEVAVNNAIRDGRLEVQPCQRCGYAIGVHAHHEDYSKPLEVTWLCKPCHGERHREINEERRRSAA